MEGVAREGQVPSCPLMAAVDISSVKDLLWESN